MAHYFLLVMIQSCETEKVAQRSEAELHCYNSFNFTCDQTWLVDFHKKRNRTAFVLSANTFYGKTAYKESVAAIIIWRLGLHDHFRLIKRQFYILLILYIASYFTLEHVHKCVLAREVEAFFDCVFSFVWVCFIVKFSCQYLSTWRFFRVGERLSKL